ncbi:hypothetical protein Verru16b_02548 [Lacunisphaera limnophila]|uniref:DUF1294 domain-containing protein n=1 Tax=Lacunisphaera limnophila TaxID=1838286 RepID=A0A1D8AX76_9BACT|nr:DUF1294 domain-containing protein [Lacunisphaera limnophila]AOS45467.1 hypothetical protein Verru16b_02548 [Lacunisphaera limnophila]
MKPERGNDRSLLSPLHLLLLAGLLVLPGWAIYRGLGPTFAAYAAGWVSAISLLAVFITWLDKRRAQSQGSREPESMLHLLELIGGWPGAFLAQRFFRHKTAKGSYQFMFWLIVLIHQALAADYLMGWWAVRTGWRLIGA